jgi:NAD(P)-dependent dehydrogenase (short-subunit alcohol dehydrogenase family)
MSQTKVWFVTGASRGLGFAIVKAALANGDRVVATVRQEPERLTRQLNDDEKLFVTILDVNDKELAKRSVANALDKFGRIDVLVNNAGYGLLGAVEEATPEEIEQNFRTNVFGLLNVTRAVLPHMRKQRSGHIINISSICGFIGFAGWGAYTATKFAVEGLTGSLAAELAPLGIFVTAVEPGFFRTDFLSESSAVIAKKTVADYAQTAALLRKTIQEMDKKQPGSPTKLARAVITLANSSQPPLHLILGKDALFQYRRTARIREKEIEAWSEITTSTDFDEPSPSDRSQPERTKS